VNHSYEKYCAVEKKFLLKKTKVVDNGEVMVLF